MSCGVGCRRGSDPALLWLWRRPVATAPIQLLAWEPPYATGAALEKTKKKKKKKNGRKMVLPVCRRFVCGWRKRDTGGKRDECKMILNVKLREEKKKKKKVF